MNILKITTDKDDERRFAPIKSGVQLAHLAVIEPVEMTTFTISCYFDKLSNRSFYLLVISLIIITLTTSCSHKFPKGHLFDIMILRKLLPISTSTTPAPNTSPTPTTTVNTNKYIFLTVAGYNGNLGGISGADTKCQTEKTNNYASLPGNASEYKAFLVSGTTRRACLNPDCSGGVTENIDWVLKANADYYRLDGTTDTKIFTTNASGIVNFTGGATLLAAIDSSVTTFWWTGLFNDWTNDVACSGNNWSLTSLQGRGGQGSVTGNASIDKGTTIGCISSTTKLLCVRQ
jgi:hypothetical protein